MKLGDKQKNYVVITRPEPGLSETILKVQKLGWKTLALPLMNVNQLSVEFTNIDQIQAILFTSRQAIISTVKLFIRQDIRYRDIPVFAVGDITAHDAKIAGFEKVQSAHKDSNALNDLIQRELFPKQGGLLFPVGKGQGKKLISNLQNSGFKMIVEEVYETRRKDFIPFFFIEKLKQGEINTILFFSSETAQFFKDLLYEEYRYLLNQIYAIAISEKVKKVLENFQWKGIVVADHPSTESMLYLIK